METHWHTGLRPVTLNSSSDLSQLSPDDPLYNETLLFSELYPHTRTGRGTGDKVHILLYYVVRTLFFDFR